MVTVSSWLGALVLAAVDTGGVGGCGVTASGDWAALDREIIIVSVLLDHVSLIGSAQPDVIANTRLSPRIPKIEPASPWLLSSDCP